MLGKYISKKNFPWQRRRQLGMALAGNTPTASFLTKIGKTQSVGCRLCRIAREAQCESPDGVTRRLKFTVTSTVQAAKEWQQQSQLPTTPSGGTCMIACTLHKSQKASSSLSLLTKKINMSTLWRREEFLRICSKEELAEKAQDIEGTKPVKKVKRHGTT